jgi:Fe(3+) dicitrate transport protein
MRRIVSASFVILVSALLTLAGVARAQDAGAVRGSVVAAETGEPIAGSAVRLVEIGRATATGPDGRFAIEGVPAGTHTLEIEALGRVVGRRVVMVGAGGAAIANLALEPSAIDAPAIRVVVDRQRIVGSDLAAATIPGSAHFIGPDELEDQKLLFDDVHRVLRQVPGVNIQEEEGYGLRPNIGLRGTGSERSSKITLMEDGVLIAPAPYAAPAAYYFPVAGRMEAIEVRKGSSQIKYGPRTVGGAINLVSSTIPERFSYLADLEGGADQTGKAHLRVGDRGRHFGWLAETYQIRTDGFKRLDGGGDVGFEIQDYLVKLAVHTRPEAETFQELELKLGRTDETSNETYLGLAESDFRTDPFRRYAGSQRDVMNAEHEQVALRWTLRPSERLDVTTVAYNNDFHRNWYKLDRVLGEGVSAVLEDPTAFPEAMAVLRGGASADHALMVRANNRTYYARGVQSSLGIQLGGVTHHAIEIGLRYHEDQEDRFQHDDAYRMEAGRMVMTREGAPGSQSNRVSDARAWALHIQDDIAFGRWTVSPGVRWETIDFQQTDYSTTDPGRTAPTRVLEDDVSAVIPGVGATFAWREGMHVFGGVHRGFGPPGPGADQETEPEESVNYELGFKLQRPWIDAQVVGFYADYDNILGKATLATGDPTGAGELFNGGAVRVVGLEVGLDVDPAAARGLAFRLPVRVAYTRTAAEFRTSFASQFEPWGTVESGDELPYLPEHQLYSSVGYERGRWATRLEANHVTAMRTTAGQGPIPAGSGTDAFTVWSASAEFSPASWSTVFAGVENLTDETYVVARQPAGARPGLPRTFLVGIRVRN